MRPLKLYLRFLGISIRGQMQYRVSIFLQSLGVFLVTGIEFFGVYALFDRFGRVEGWSLEEVAVLYGLVNMVFAVADALTRGFDTLGEQIRTGSFDRYLLRPRSTVLQLLGYEFTLRRSGRFLQGAAVLLFGWRQLSLSAVSFPFLIVVMIAGVSLFCGILIFQGCITFWTVETLEIMNILTYGGSQTAHFPLSIYRKGLQLFFIYIVPIGLVTYFPVCTLLGRPPLPGIPAWAGYITLLSGPVFLLAALGAWRIGVRHYTSTGS